MKIKSNYLESIYNFVNNNVEEASDKEFEIIDDDYVYGEDDYEPEWGEEVEIIGDDEEDDFMYDLGEGYIPLPQGEDVEVEVLVIDENYVPDEYEKDVCGDYTDDEEEFVVIDEDDELDEVNEIKEMLDGESSDMGVKQFENVESDFDDLLNADNCSVIKLPKNQTLAESLNTVDVSSEDKRIAHSIAREHMEKCEAEMQIRSLPGAESEDEEHLSAKWIGEDMFGNNIEGIIAEDPNAEKLIEDDDFVEGSFEDWASQQGICVH